MGLIARDSEALSVEEYENICVQFARAPPSNFLFP